MGYFEFSFGAFALEMFDLYAESSFESSDPEFGVWTKRGVGHGLPYGPSYGIPVVNLKARLSIAATLCKQRAPSICQIGDSVPSSWQRFAQIFKVDSW